MKKLLTLLLVLCCSIQASGIFDDFAIIDDQVRLKLGLAVTDTVTITDTVIHQFTREALVTLNTGFQGTIKRDTVLSAYFQNTYSLDSLTAEVISVCWESHDSIKSLIYLPKSQWFEQGLKELKGKKGYEVRPSFYDVEIIDTTTVYLNFFPTPVITSDTFIVSYAAFTPNIETCSTLSSINRRLPIAVVRYAAYLCAVHLKSPAAETLYRDFLFSIGGTKDVAPAP